jgi:hypothetical protein
MVSGIGGVGSGLASVGLPAALATKDSISLDTNVKTFDNSPDDGADADDDAEDPFLVVFDDEDRFIKLGTNIRKQEPIIYFVRVEER